MVRSDRVRPSTSSLRSVRSASRVRHEQGDVAEAVREVDHFVVFEDPASLARAAAALGAAGFRCDEPSPPSEEDPRWKLQLHRDEALDGHHPYAMVNEVLDDILPLGGEYDGWGAVLVKP